MTTFRTIDAVAIGAAVAATTAAIYVVLKEAVDKIEQSKGESRGR